MGEGMVGTWEQLGVTVLYLIPIQINKIITDLSKLILLHRTKYSMGKNWNDGFIFSGWWVLPLYFGYLGCSWS